MFKYYVKRVSGSDVWGIEVSKEVLVFVSVARQCRQGVAGESQSGGGGGGGKDLTFADKIFKFWRR